MFYPTTDHISNCYLVVTRNRHFCREIDALFSRRFLAFPASVKTACASLNLRPHLLLLSIKSACGGGSQFNIVNIFIQFNPEIHSILEDWGERLIDDRHNVGGFSAFTGFSFPRPRSPIFLSAMLCV